MALFLIAYDLRKPGQDYIDIDALIEGWGGRRVLQSTWMVERNASVKDVLNALNSAMDINDKVVVADVNDWVSFGI